MSRRRSITSAEPEASAVRASVADREGREQRDTTRSSSRVRFLAGADGGRHEQRPAPGTHIWRATVVDFLEPEHIPLGVNDEVIESHGDSTSQGENMDAICSAIAP